MYSSTLESRKAGKVDSPVFTVKVRVTWCLQEDQIGRFGWFLNGVETRLVGIGARANRKLSKEWMPC